MQAVELQLEKRDGRGKGPARKARATGRIPGVLYGHKQEPLTFSVDGHGLSQTLAKSPFGRNQVLALRGVDRDVEALIKDVQVHPVSRAILHLDLIEVRDGDRVVVEVPIRHQGKAAGQSAGGTLVLLKRSVRIACVPAHIPAEVMLDVTPLGVGEDITVGSLPLPEGATPIGDPKVVVLTVRPPRVSGKAQEAEPAAGKKK